MKRKFNLDNGPIPNARAAAGIKLALECMARELPPEAVTARKWYLDAAALLTPTRWHAVRARPELAGRLCRAAYGITQPPKDPAQ